MSEPSDSEEEDDAQPAHGDDPVIEHHVRSGRMFAESLGADPKTLGQELDDMFKGVVLDSYVGPLLEAVKECGVESAAAHARRIGVNRGTTARWWRSFAGDGPEVRHGYPDIDTFLLTLAGFNLDPADVLRAGSDVSLDAWRACIRHVAVHVTDLNAAEHVTREEMICLTLIWQCVEWQRAIATNRSEDFQEAAAWILNALQCHVSDGRIRTLTDIKAVAARLFVASTIAFSVLKYRWLVE